MYLPIIISDKISWFYRQLMVMDETYVINQLKEDVCYVSQNFMKDMEIARWKMCFYLICYIPDWPHG